MGQPLALLNCQAGVAREAHETNRAQESLRTARGHRQPQDDQDASRRHHATTSKHRAPAKDFYFKKGHDNQQCRSMLAMVTAREMRRLAVGATGMGKRKCEQLVTLGILDRKATVKTENNVPERWALEVPQEVPFTVEGLFAAMIKGKIKPLYGLDGKHIATSVDGEAD